MRRDADRLGPPGPGVAAVVLMVLGAAMSVAGYAGALVPDSPYLVLGLLVVVGLLSGVCGLVLWWAQR